MGLFDWFSKEARQGRQREREAAAVVRRTEKRRLASQVVLTALFDDEGSTTLLAFQNSVAQARNEFSGQATLPAEDAKKLYALYVLDAAVWLFQAENRILIRESTTDAYGQGNYESDKVAWQGTAENCIQLLVDAQKIALTAGHSILGGMTAEIETRARILETASLADLRAAGHEIPILPFFQSGAGSVRFSPGVIAWNFPTMKGTSPLPKYVSVKSIRPVLKELPEYELLVHLLRSLLDQ